MRKDSAGIILLAFCLTLLLATMTPRQAIAHTGDEHNEELEKILFDMGDFSKKH